MSGFRLLHGPEPNGTSDTCTKTTSIIPVTVERL